MNRREFCWAMAVFGAAVKAKCAPLATGTAPASTKYPSPCFSPVDSTPLGYTPDKAIVLHRDWQMKEEAICGNHGAVFSQAGFSAKQSWYPTTVPATTQGTLVRHGIYPDPYVGINNTLIPDASPEHSESFGLAKYSHLPNKENPWARPYWFRTEVNLISLSV